MFLILFFLTTPAYVVQIMTKISMANNNATDPNDINQSSPLVTEFLPTLMLWSLTAIMPIIVAYSESWLSHWTRSRENYAIMTKTFGYLLFMILILPSLGLLSASAFLEWSLSLTNSSGTVKFACIFLPDRGAFFVNYIITMCFIGTALELIRFPDLIMYIYKILTARSEAETPHIRKSIVIEFVFGIHYSWTIMVFTMATVYSLACPLITPFALIYLMLKNFNDKHNLYFAYGKYLKSYRFQIFINFYRLIRSIAHGQSRRWQNSFYSCYHDEVFSCSLADSVHRNFIFTWRQHIHPKNIRSLVLASWLADTFRFHVADKKVN